MYSINPVLAHLCVTYTSPLMSNSALTSFAELLIHTLKEAGAQLGITLGCVAEVGV